MKLAIWGRVAGIVIGCGSNDMDRADKDGETTGTQPLHSSAHKEGGSGK